LLYWTLRNSFIKLIHAENVTELVLPHPFQTERTAVRVGTLKERKKKRKTEKKVKFVI
jgi:hypothetical protein